MADLVYSLYVEIEAKKLLQIRDRWVRARNKETGVSFVAVPSGAKIYHVHPSGKGCDCEATQHWNVKMCKHRRAVQLANAAEEEAAVHKAEVELAFMALATEKRGDGAGAALIRRYEDVFGEED